MKDIKYLAGIDEVGRGPLAGPVTVGIFMAPAKYKLSKEITDSKALTEKKREKIFEEIKKDNKVKFLTISMSADSIDKKGIAVCIRESIKKGLLKIGCNPKNAKIYLDGGLKAPDEYIYQETVIKGDSKIPVIGAASIVAKVTRDRYMVKQDIKYPQYGLGKHKGYGTKDHRESIKKYGLSPLHRKSFIHFI